MTRTFFLSIGLTTSATCDPCSCKCCNSSLKLLTKKIRQKIDVFFQIVQREGSEFGSKIEKDAEVDVDGIPCKGLAVSYSILHGDLREKTSKRVKAGILDITDQRLETRKNRPRACVRSNFVIAGDECLSLNERRSFQSESSLSCQTMHFEIEIAGDFVVSFLTDLSMEKIEEVHYNLSKILTDRYEGHWYPSQPTKGNAYRCLNDVDPVLIRAIQRSGLNPNEILRYFPENLSVWVDPNEVSYRIGDRGIETLYCESSQCAGTVEPSQKVATTSGYSWESPLSRLRAPIRILHVGGVVTVVG